MTTDKIKLTDCREEETGSCGGTRWTHEETGAYVELIHDGCPHHPLDDMEGVAISFREGDHYNGTTDDHPRDPTITCPSCEGSGESDRYELRDPFKQVIVASGTQEAMEVVAILFGISLWMIYARDCPRCETTGEIDCDLETWFRVTLDAVAIYEFDTGDHGEASAVMVITNDDWTDPQDAAKAWAEEYKSWAEGDCWGIEYGGPGVETESVWGFIGRENAEENAQNNFLQYAIDGARVAVADALKERDEAAYWTARDVVTV